MSSNSMRRILFAACAAGALMIASAAAADSAADGAVATAPADGVGEEVEGVVVSLQQTRSAVQLAAPRRRRSCLASIR